ncbi:MAG: glycosyl transferase [Acidiferrobacteraceae bacterium]
MTSSDGGARAEHFVTLFDNNFLPVGLCLHASLLQQGQPFQLWIICMDDLVERNLRQLALPFVRLLPLAEVEQYALRAVKPARTLGEYCWTLTPFAPEFVLDRDPGVARVTYLDADLFFFDAPQLLIEEFVASGKHVLITEHAYGPRYARSGRARRGGRFCVQFITFRRTVEAAKVMHWWQERCLEWCYARVEDGKFGDQKYLDVWPELFAQEVHILGQKEKALAPWNVAHYEAVGRGHIAPVFYHFHGLRLESPARLLLYSGYQVGAAADELYGAYVTCLRRMLARLGDLGIPAPYLRRRNDLLGKCITYKRRLVDGEKSIPLHG